MRKRCPLYSQKRTSAERVHNQKDRLAAVSLRNQIRCLDYAAIAATLLRFLRRAIRPIAPAGREEGVNRLTRGIERDLFPGGLRNLVIQK
jgi:hypothetical protein